MKKTAHRHTRNAAHPAVNHWERRLRAALRAQRVSVPDLFSDRDDDAMEYRSLMREFECAREEALGAESYN